MMYVVLHAIQPLWLPRRRMERSDRLTSLGGKLNAPDVSGVRTQKTSGDS